jgi:methionine salvage enolase-phosphatase E1
MYVVLDWNGVDVPDELRELPKGRYVVVALDDAPELDAAQEAGLEAALAAVRDGRGVPLEDARDRVMARLGR